MINSIAVALIDNTWWVWWGDESGRVMRRDVTRQMRAPQHAPQHARDVTAAGAETVVSTARPRTSLAAKNILVFFIRIIF